MKIAIFIIWAFLVLCGFWKLFVYSQTPGLQSPNADWPKGSKLTKNERGSTLVIFLHPQCPCSQATIGELERLMPFIQGKVKILVVFVQSENRSEEWTKQDLWNQVSSIPKVEMILDEKAREAIQFSAQTSGQVFFFNEKAQLIFKGGLTPARGHRGDSFGREVILSYIKNPLMTKSEAPVFGCSLPLPLEAKAPRRLENYATPR